MKHLIHKAATTLTNLDNKINYATPGFYSIWRNNGKPIKSKGHELKETINRRTQFHTYLGKIPDPKMQNATSKNKMYTETFIRMILYKLFTETPGVATIVLGTIVNEICNGPDSMNGHLSVTESIEYIRDIANTYYPEHVNRLRIIGIESLAHNKDLFTHVTKSDDIKQLIEFPSEELDSNKIDSYNVFKYLLRLYQNDTQFAEDINGIKVKDTSFWASKYYAIMEIACRLADFFSGTSVQGGAEKQSDYDNILVELINQKSRAYPRADILRQVANKLNIWDFIKVYFDHHNAEKLVQQLEEKDNTAKSALGEVRNKLKRFGIYTSLIGILTSGAWYWMDTYKKNKQKAKQRIERATKMAAYVEQNDQYAWVGNLRPTSRSVIDALRERDNYNEYTSKKLQVSYNLSATQLEKLQEPFLTWYVKNKNRYVMGSQFSNWDPIIYAIHDFINEKGDVFAITPKDYMSYMTQPQYPQAMENTLHVQGGLEQEKFYAGDVKDTYTIPLTFTTFDDDIGAMEIGYITRPNLGHPVAKSFAAPYTQPASYLVGRYPDEESFTIQNGKRAIDMYYANYPWVNAMTKFITEHRDIQDYRDGWDIKGQLSNLIKQWYRFDYYVLTWARSSNYYIDYFIKTFIKIPSNNRIPSDSSRTWVQEATDYNLSWVLSDCIEHIKKQYSSSEYTLSTEDANALKSIIFMKLYTNWALRQKYYKVSEIIASVEEEIKRYLDSKQPIKKSNWFRWSGSLSYHGLGRTE
jgi:hypothetical protein